MAEQQVVDNNPVAEEKEINADNTAWRSPSDSQSLSATTRLLFRVIRPINPDITWIAWPDWLMVRRVESPLWVR